MQSTTNLGKILPSNCDLDKTAIIDLSSNSQSYSFRQIDQRSDAVARGLLSKQISTGDKISILSDNSASFISTFFGAMRIGAVPVLINTKLSDTQIEKILSETNSKLLFTDQNKKFIIETIQFGDSYENFLDFGNIEIYNPTDTDIAFIMYTSGSSGAPKGAMLTHKGHLWSVKRNVDHDTTWSHKRISLISAPLYHANGLTTFEGSFAGGSTIVLMSKFNSSDAIKTIEQYRINTMFCIPTMIAMMVNDEIIKDANLTSMRHIRSASSHFSEHLLESVKKYFPNAVVLNSYGITEVGPGLFGRHPDGINRPITSVGYPAEGIEYKLIDDILYVKSPSMQLSYYQSSSNDNLTSDGFFNTKDMFRIDEDGFYYFLGRSDDMFKCGGNRVYPADVEAILESHPSVNSSVVLGLDDEIKGTKPYAFVVLNSTNEITEEELKQYCLSNGPAYQHPRRIWFLDQMPLTGTNKINKKELERMAIENLTNQL